MIIVYAAEISKNNIKMLQCSSICKVGSHIIKPLKCKLTVNIIQISSLSLSLLQFEFEKCVCVYIDKNSKLDDGQCQFAPKIEFHSSRSY